MKKFLALSLTCLALALPVNVQAEARVKEVCRVQKDKDGKDKKVCKKVKVHKKLDGTPVPPAK